MRVSVGRLKRIIREVIDPESWYYDYEPGMTLDDIIRLWQHPKSGNDRRGNPLPRQKMYDRSQPVMIPTSELWPHREYTRSKENGSRSYAEWDELRDSLKTNGWDPGNPLMFNVGETGTKVGEGNHRLALARELGIKEIPVEFHFQTGNVVKTKLLTPVERLAREKKRQRQMSAPTKREPVEFDSEKEKQVDDLMKMLF